MEQLKGLHTVIVITHNFDSAAHTADYCGILNQGSLVCFSPVEELRERAKVIVVARARGRSQLNRHLSAFTEESSPSSLLRNQYFCETRFEREDLKGLVSFILQNKQRTVTLSSLSLNALIMDLSESKDSSLSLSQGKNISQFSKLSSLASPSQPSEDGAVSS